MINRADIERAQAGERLDDLLSEPFKHDDPARAQKIAERLAWALEAGTAELSLYIDLTKYTTLPVLYREYAALFAMFHLERTTRAGSSQPSRDTYDLVHKNLAMAHKGERLPGEREQRSTVRAHIIEDESRWSDDSLAGLV